MVLNFLDVMFYINSLLVVGSVYMAISRMDFTWVLVGILNAMAVLINIMVPRETK